MPFTQTIVANTPIRRRSRAGAKEAVSLERFDDAALLEAQKIILGTSRWFGFETDADGKAHLKNLRPDEYPEKVYQEEADKEMLQKVLHATETYEAKLTSLQDPARLITNEKIRALKQEADALHAIANETHNAYRALKKSVLAGAEGLSDDELEAKLKSHPELEEAHGVAWEADAAFEAVRSKYHSARNKEKKNQEDEAYALERVLEIVRSYKKFDAEWAELEANVAEYHKTLATQGDATEPKNPKWLANDIAFFARHLEDVCQLYDAEKADGIIARLEALAGPTGVYKSYRQISAEQKEQPDEMERSGSLSPRGREMVTAAISLLTNHVVKLGHKADECQLTAVSNDSPLMRGFERMLGGGDSYRAPLDEMREDGDMQLLQQELEQLDKLQRGDDSGKPDEDEIRRLSRDDYEYRQHLEMLWDKDALLRDVMTTANTLRDRSSSDLWRLHNSYPDAVNFIFAYHEGEQLMNHNGSKVKITKPEAFMGSAWVNMAHNFEFTLDAALLDKVRGEVLAQQSHVSLV